MLDPRNELASNRVEQFDLFGKRNASYESWRQGNYGARARKTAQNYENRWSWNVERAKHRPLNTKDESGIQSPHLRTTSPQRSPVHPRHQTSNYRSSSPTSRAQAIACGQRELMEMVKNLPDTSFELTLKDIVEHPGGESQEACLLKNQNYVDHQVVAHQRVNKKKHECKKNEKKAKMINGSMDNRGLFLKMVFPVSLISKKKNTMDNNSSTSAKVSPKPEFSDRTNSKSGDKDWWKKRVSFPRSNRSSSKSGSSGSSSSSSSGCRSSPSRSSSGSSSSSIRNKGGIMNGCWLGF